MKKLFYNIQTLIILALILGALFGALFNIDQSTIIIKHKSQPKGDGVLISEWSQFLLVVDKTDTIRFAGGELLAIQSKIKELKKADADITVAVKEAKIGEEGVFQISVVIDGVTGSGRVETAATSIKFIGDVFIRLLNMVAIPLVLASLIVGAASLGNIRKFARIGGKTLAFYMTTTAIAVTIGLFLANSIQPGKMMDPDTKDKLAATYSEESQQKLESNLEFSLIEQFVNMVPKNPIKAFADGDMLQIVFFAVFFGMILTMIGQDKSRPIITVLDGISEAMIKMVDIIMYAAPLGVFSLIAATVGQFGFEILQTLLWYTLTVLFGLLLHNMVVYGSALKLLTKVPLGVFLKGIRRAQTIAFSTSSSAATLPVSMECCQDNLGISKSITSFVLPLGATVNMDGTAMLQGIAAVFIAQVYGIPLDLGQQLTIVVMATMASIGTAPVPGVGIIMLIIILRSVGIPESGIALILGVDRILDMARTTTNITGALVAAAIIASSEKEIELPVSIKE